MKLRLGLIAVAVIALLVFLLWPGSEVNELDTPQVQVKTDRARTTTSDESPRRAEKTAPTPQQPDDIPPTLQAVLSSAADASTADSADGGTAAAAALRAWFEANAAAADKNVDAWCEQAKQVKRPPPDTTTRKRDASSFLTVRLDWEDNVRPPGLLHLPEALRTRLKGYAGNWPALVTDADLEGLDFSWFTALHEYDYWNLIAEGPLRESRDRDYYRAPIPNFTELQLWTKLRFAKALRTGDFVQASADVHQLVALLRTTNTVIADMVAVALLNFERMAAEQLASLGRAVPDGLYYSADETARERRLGRTAMFFMLPGVSEKTMKKAFACNASFKCGALAEGLGWHTVTKDVFPASTLSTVESLLAGAGCNDELMQWIRSAAQRSAQVSVDSLGPAGTLERVLLPDGGS